MTEHDKTTETVTPEAGAEQQRPKLNLLRNKNVLV